MLYAHTQAFHGGLHGPVHNWVRRSLRHSGRKYLKTLDPNRVVLAALKDEFPDLEVWLRHYWPPEEQHLDNPRMRGFAAADAVIADLDNNQIRHLVTYVSSYNEVLGTGYREFETAFDERMSGEGFRTISYNFSVGQPADLADWPSLYLPVPGDLLGLNQYHAPDLEMENEKGPNWSLYRHEQLPVHGKAIMIGEFGIDTGVITPILGGWRSTGISVQSYCDQLRRAAHRLAAARNVRAAFVYNVGVWHPWESFEVADVPEIADVLAEVGNLNQGDSVIQPINADALGPGFRELYDKAKAYTGEPKEAEWTVTKENIGSVLQTVRFERGMAWWYPAANYVTFGGSDGTVIRVRAGQVSVLRP